MKNVKELVQLIVSLCLCAAVSVQAATPAFPEAQGFGAFTKGGRGGEVFIVTTTGDYDEGEPVIKGSFREAVEAAIPRTVVFEVSGMIELKRLLQIDHPYITIAGQTAPGDGICLKDYGFSLCADESIVRYLRVRVGDVHRLETDAIDIDSAVDNSGQLSDLRNNVFYNWGATPGYSNDDEHVRINLVGNYYKPGPSTKPSRSTIAFNVASLLNSIYVADNHHSNNPEAAKDNWRLIGSRDGTINKQSAPFPHPPMKNKIGEEIYELVLNGAGAVLPVRDSVDRRIIDEIRSGQGSIINSQKDVGGWPVYKTTKAPLDNDRDGMADKWELVHGLSATDPTDHKNDADEDGYTNLEEYLNGTNPNAATASLQDYAQYKAALDELDALNVAGYAEAEAFEAARLKLQSNLSEPKVKVSFSERPDAKVKNLTVLLNDSVEIEMVLVEAGTFMMGSPESEPGRLPSWPSHRPHWAICRQWQRHKCSLKTCTPGGEFGQCLGFRKVSSPLRLQTKSLQCYANCP
jgi:hypothetical protein